MISNRICSFILKILIVILIIACSSDSDQKSSLLFTKINPDSSGIHFSNTIKGKADLNVMEYPLLYNGGGVAIGDINNDGLSDIFVTGNMVSSRLYLNKGNLKFEDISEFAGIMTERWITGVSMIDINNDDNLDIYLSVASAEDAPPIERANLLFINRGDNTFTESAKKYNIADTSFTTHSVFLDYNKDGLLDLFLLNHSPGSFSRSMGQKTGGLGNTSKSYDKLYRNNGDGSFSDVSVDAGILQKTGFGLGVAVNDINRDGWPDIYVSNDITPDDVLYINNRDGTFTDKAKKYLKHTSYAGMGIDISDFNNDGWPDILQVDMMPPDLNNRKKMSYGVNYEHFRNKIKQGYHYSYTKNTLQLNNGIDSVGNLVYSEIGRLSGIAYTGWSWSGLFGDYDNSGYRDIMITNGYPKAVNDFDFIVNSTQITKQEQKLELLDELKKLKLKNYFFKNKGDLTYSDVSEKWGFQQSTYSYGAAHADLDNDGDLDLVINNVNALVSLYQNNSNELLSNHYLTINLIGHETNRQGIGAKVVLSTGKVKQYAYLSPYRGYQSSMEPRLHFGLGNTARIDSLEIFWPDNRYQLETNVETNQQVSFNYSNSSNAIDNSYKIKKKQRFVDISNESGLDYEHVENKFNDYQIQPLLDKKLSKMGPKIAVGDVNNDGMDDFFIGGAADFPGNLFIQKENGEFELKNKNQPWLNDVSSEVMGGIFFHANKDSLLDLYVTSGGYEFPQSAEVMQDRLYINLGSGKFYKEEAALPEMRTSTSAVAVCDFDEDGDMDLFVGGRLTPLKYPYGTRSYLLENEEGTFRDVTPDFAPELANNSNLITDAEWVDYNKDGQPDLVVAGEWMSVNFYKNNKGKLENVTDLVFEQPQTGWWFSLEKGDFNNDGYTDLVAGNLGLNHTFTTSEKKRFEVFADDFNQDMTTDIIYAFEEDGTHYPFFGRARLGQTLDLIRNEYNSFKSFANQTMSDIFTSEQIEKSVHYQADTFASMYFQNNGDGTFTTNELPNSAQLSPILDLVSHDLDKDGNLDLISAGNIFSVHPDVSRADAGNGLWMKGNGNGNFKAISPFKSGLLAPHDVKDIKLIKTSSGINLLVTNNSGKLQLFHIN